MSFLFFELESAVILRSDKKHGRRRLADWKNMAGLSLWVVNWPFEIRKYNTVVKFKVTPKSDSTASLFQVTD